MGTLNSEFRDRPAPQRAQIQDTGGADGAALENYLDPDGHERLAAAMASLPAPWRTVLWCAEVLGETPLTIATAQGIEPSAVSILLLQAKAGLRAAYSGWCPSS